MDIYISPQEMRTLDDSNTPILHAGVFYQCANAVWPDVAGLLIEQHRLLAFRHRVHIVLGHHAFADIRPRR